MAQLVTFVNRTSKPLVGTWNGLREYIAPGKHSFPLFQAQAYRRQNPIMGSEDPRTGEMKYLVGIEEEGDDCSPLTPPEATPIDPTTGKPFIERWDRRHLTQARPTEIVPGDNGIYSVRDVSSTPLPLSTDFTKA